jgi:hypothetical protein
MEHRVLAEELLVVDGDSALFRPVRPLLEAALRLEQQDESYCWRGWTKRQLASFLASLPAQCSLVAGVWGTIRGGEGGEGGEGDEEQPGRETLVLGMVCEVREGEVRSIRTFEALAEAGLKPAQQLEPGVEDGLEIMRAARELAGPVAFALFIEEEAWNEWVYASGENDGAIDKGEALASLARQGRCVLMGSQVPRHHH